MLFYFYNYKNIFYHMTYPDYATHEAYTLHVSLYACILFSFKSPHTSVIMKCIRELDLKCIQLLDLILYVVLESWAPVVEDEVR